MSIVIDGEWFHAVRGTYALIPGGTPTHLKIAGPSGADSISLNIPGGFELAMPRIVQSLAANPLGDAGTQPV